MQRRLHLLLFLLLLTLPSEFGVLVSLAGLQKVLGNGVGSALDHTPRSFKSLCCSILDVSLVSHINILEVKEVINDLLRVVYKIGYTVGINTYSIAPL